MGNQLTTLPPEIGNLTKLTYLDLKGNQLTSLPPEIGNLTELKEFKLEGNNLSDLKPEIIGGINNSEVLRVIANVFIEKKDYPNAYAYLKKLVVFKRDDYYYWFNLSYYSLFAKKYDEAIFAAQKTLEIDPDARSVEANLVLGCLLNNQWEKAEEIYVRWRGKTFPDDQEGRLCDDIFLKDIYELEEAGIHHPDFKKVKEMFNKK
jgi:Leucine-rich repeat (LRR) protein